VKKRIILASFFAFAVGAAGIAVSVPVVDTFAEGDQQLRLVGLPGVDGESIQVTLVYADQAEQTLQSITVDPSLVATEQAAAFAEFLASLDPDFVSFVRASLADRLLHLRKAPTAIERAAFSLFFPNTDVDAYIARSAAARVYRTE
jgi:hypothetical protein